MRKANDDHHTVIQRALVGQHDRPDVRDPVGTWGLRGIGSMEERAEGCGMPRGAERAEPARRLEGRRPGAVKIEQKAPHEDRDLWHSLSCGKNSNTHKL